MGDTKGVVAMTKSEETGAPAVGALAEMHKPAGNLAAPEAGWLGRMIERGGYVFAAGIVLAALILLMEVFLRYAFGRPTIWAHETTTFLCGTAFLYGGLFCTARNSHIRVVLIYDLLSAPVRRWFNVFISLVSFAAAGFFAYATFIMVEKSFITPAGLWRMETSGSAWNPPTPALLKAFLLGVLVLMSLQFVVLAFNYLRRADEDLPK